ncbi:MAG: DNA-processing protein DprA [Clostridiales bacterium]|nr:DNA-processing protein DprA [Clostridiales bacterium]
MWLHKAELTHVQRGVLEHAYPDLHALWRDMEHGAARKAVGETVFGKLKLVYDPDALAREVAEAEKQDVHILTYADERYPDTLRNIPDYPYALYYRGNVDLLATRCLAIVGTRRASVYGERMTKKFAAVLAQVGLTVVSGMATGIDTYAHEAALDVNGKTIAVLGTGILRPYPATNGSLYDAIVDRGLVLSEYAGKQEGSNYSFPQRNRIIAGISEGVLMAEGAEKSGGMITVGRALEYGRQVFVLPGNADADSFQGNLKLIREAQGALVYRPAHIFEELGMRGGADKPTERLQLDFFEAKIYELLALSEMTFDVLMERSDLTVSALAGLLTQMEMKGLVLRRGSLYYKA